MDGLSELEQLEAINATQDFLLSEPGPVDISKYLDEDGECCRFEKPTANEQIQQRERDLNILAKNDANFSSFRNALDSRMKEMTSAGIDTTKNVADPLTLADEELLWSSGTIGFHSSQALSYAVFFCNCKVFGFRAMNEHVNLVVEQYEFGSTKLGNLLDSMAESRKMYKVAFNNAKLM